MRLIVFEKNENQRKIIADVETETVLIGAGKVEYRARPEGEFVTVNVSDKVAYTIVQ